MGNNKKMSSTDLLILSAYPIIGIILILVIAYDPLNFFDNSSLKLSDGLIVGSILFIPFLYHRKKILDNMKK